MIDGSCSEEQALDLLKQLEHILESDPHIDEVGYIHPVKFPEPAGGSPFGKSEFQTMEYDNSVFWNSDHKLAISTEVLLPLYKVATRLFMDAIRKYKLNRDVSAKKDAYGDKEMASSLSSSESVLEIDIMKISKSLLLLTSDFGSAWNYRKLIVSKKQQLPIFLNELLLSTMVLSYSPKSDHAWSHRRWVIKMIAGKCSKLQEILGKESELVKKIAEIYKMNYRAWNHRYWLVSYMNEEQVLHELEESRNGGDLYVPDNCCLHYRRRLLLRTLKDLCSGQDPTTSFCSDTEVYQVWKEELDFNAVLIKRNIGTESLWLHRRFLSRYWINHFAKSSTSHDISIFTDNELQLVNSCLAVPHDEISISTDDQIQVSSCTQALLSATYILWLTKYVAVSERFALQGKLKLADIKRVLYKTWPEKINLWDCLLKL